MSEREQIVAFIRKYSAACKVDQREIAATVTSMLADAIERGLHLSEQGDRKR